MSRRDKSLALNLKRSHQTKYTLSLSVTLYYSVQDTAINCETMTLSFIINLTSSRCSTGLHAVKLLLLVVVHCIFPFKGLLENAPPI